MGIRVLADVQLYFLLDIPVPAVPKIVDAVKRCIELIVITGIERTSSTMLSGRCPAGVIVAVKVICIRILTAYRVNDCEVSNVKGGGTTHRCDVDVFYVDIYFSS